MPCALRWKNKHYYYHYYDACAGLTPKLEWFNVLLLIGVAVTALESFEKIRGLTSVVAVGHKVLSHHNLRTYHNSTDITSLV